MSTETATAFVRSKRQAAGGWGESDSSSSPAKAINGHERPTAKEKDMGGKREANKARTRQQLLEALAGGALSMGELQEQTGIAGATIFKHMAPLIAHGLVKRGEGHQGKFERTGKDPAEAFKSGNGAPPPTLKSCSERLQIGSRPAQRARHGKGVPSASASSMRRSSSSLNAWAAPA